MTQFLSVEQVIELHDLEKVCPIIDRGKLESAVGQPAATWEGEVLYPTLLQQAAAYLVSLAGAHGFEDANKRTSWLTCVTFLDINGVQIQQVPKQEAADFVVQVVEEHLGVPEVAAWLLERTL